MTKDSKVGVYTEKIGHWYCRPNDKDRLTSGKAEGFVYMVEFDNGEYYIGRKYTSSPSGKKVYWESYKTSSRLVKKRIKEGMGYTMVILQTYTNRDETIDAEIEFLKSHVGLEKCLNQCVTHDKMVRRYESYQDPEFLANWRRGLEEYISRDDYVHPLQGKEHPNKGKELPQTAAKNPIMRTHKLATDGKENKMVERGSELPEGWRWGYIKHKEHVETPAVKQAREVIGRRHTERAQKRYYENPNFCKVCGGQLEYEKKYRKTCSEACYNKNYTQNPWDNSISDEKRMEVVRKRNQEFAEKRGFSDYDSYCQAVADYYATNRIEDVCAKFNVSKSGVQGACRRIGFNKSDFKKESKK